MLHQSHMKHAQPELQYGASAVPDSNPYAYLSIVLEASKSNDRFGKGQGLSNGNGSSAAVSTCQSCPCRAPLCRQAKP